MFRRNQGVPCYQQRQAARESKNCSSTCTCSAIQWKTGIAGEDRICNWRLFRVHQKADPMHVKWANNTAQLALFVSMKVTVCHKNILLGDFSCL